MNCEENLTLKREILSMGKNSFLLCLAFFIYGCGDDEPKVTDPKVAILGKWELVENNFGPISTSDYEEYLADSVKRSYSSKDNTFNDEKYWIEDSLLIISFKYVDEFDTIVFRQPYEFTFLSYNKLRLDFKNPAIVTKYIYQRKK